MTLGLMSFTNVESSSENAESKKEDLVATCCTANVYYNGYYVASFEECVPGGGINAYLIACELAESRARTFIKHVDDNGF